MNTDRRSAFLASRKGGMGGTDMAMLLGLGFDGKDALDLFYDKTRPHDSVEVTEETIHQLRGHVTEPLAADLYWGFTGRKGRKAPAEFTHPDYPAFKCHLDYEVFSDEEREEWKRGTGVLDIKAPMTAAYGKVVEHGIRPYESIQMQTYLAVTRRSWGSLGYCNLEHQAGPIYTIDVQADEKLGKFLLELGQRFWDEHVMTGTPPNPDEWRVLGKEGTPPLVERDGTLLVIEEPSEALVEQANNLLQAIELKKRGEALEKAGKTVVQAIMEDELHRDRIEIPNVGKFTMVRQQGRKSFREDTLRAARPIDRDKLLNWMNENGFIDSTSTSVFTLEDLEAMTLDIGMFVKQGEPFAFLKSTDKRPEEATYND